MRSEEKIFIQALQGKQTSRPPIWLMRQAGRYLPEYKKIRKEAGSFLDLCFNPDFATEVTLQPIRRFGFDASILFSDILVIPHALGQKLWFAEGEGPKLEALKGEEDFERLTAANLHEVLGPVYQTVRNLRQSLPKETALIGFAGAPWTVASYMIEGGGTKDFMQLKKWAFGQPELFQRLIDLLVDVTADYLLKQVEAGAEALQIFDSWAGVIPAGELNRWSLDPIERIAKKVKAVYQSVPVIAFPRGVGLGYLSFAESGVIDCLSLDQGLPLPWIGSNLQNKKVVQGNLDPVSLLVGGEHLKTSVGTIIENLSGGPFVFNLGHGIIQYTNPDHVTRLVELVRGNN
jgi:uroporphyrinogen decarboxylase